MTILRCSIWFFISVGCRAALPHGSGGGHDPGDLAFPSQPAMLSAIGGGSSAGFVVAALNAASAASREVVVLRVLSSGILCPRVELQFLKRHARADPVSRG
jgi:hypothetical protein